MKIDMKKRWGYPVIIALFILSLLCLQGCPGCDPCPAGKFTIVLLPDTQYYSQLDPETYEEQMNWIVGHKDEMNIVFVIHLGDITDENNDYEWKNAREAHDILDDAGIPYSMLPGNHDYFQSFMTGYEPDTTRYNEYFGPDKFETLDWAVGGLYGHMEENENDYNYTLFWVCGMSFMVVSLAYAPTEEALTWANDVIADNPNRRVIVATHAYLTHDAELLSIGRNIKNNLVDLQSNIFMVVCGHIGDVEKIEDPDYYAILTDYQYEKRNVTIGALTLPRNNGNGWLRTMTFVPDENRIYVESISVYPDVDRFNYPENSDPYSWYPLASEHFFNLYYPMD